MSEYLLELKNINMVFKKRGAKLGTERHFHVLKNLDLEIKPGEIMVLVGESGCGKTTVGKIITGLLQPTSGEIIFNGTSLSRFSSVYKDFRQSVQFIQQDSYAALNPVRTIYQNLETAINTVSKRMPFDEKEKKMAELLGDVGLVPAEQFLYKYPHQLSGGQRQRVLMARALALKPKLIVADEPVSMIDVSLRISILNLMLDLNRQRGISFVYITHDLSTAKYIAAEGNICVMYLGEIMEKSRLEALLKKPKHPYTQTLISAVPIPDPKLAKVQPKVPIKSMELMDIEHRKEGCPFADRCLYASDECSKEIPVKEYPDGAKVRCVKDAPPTDISFDI